MRNEVLTSRQLTSRSFIRVQSTSKHREQLNVEKPKTRNLTQCRAFQFQSSILLIPILNVNYLQTKVDDQMAHYFQFVVVNLDVLRVELFFLSGDSFLLPLVFHCLYIAESLTVRCCQVDEYNMNAQASFS